MRAANEQRDTESRRPGIDGAAQNPKREIRFPADRELQDHIIRYLADTGVQVGDHNPEFLDQKQAQRASRFSRFLARRYYRDRLQRGFRHSNRLVTPDDAAHSVVDREEFDSILSACALGSIASSRKVGELAVNHLLPLRSEQWWSELLQYELAFFMQLATSESTSPNSVPKRNTSAILRDFQTNIPALLARLNTGEGLTEFQSSPMTLLFSRTNHGQIYVVELDRNAQAVFSEIDGACARDQIATRYSLSPDEIRRILNTLQNIGAVVMPAE
jgi:hypothetical protein